LPQVSEGKSQRPACVLIGVPRDTYPTRLRLDLARLEVAERDAAPIALLINELVTNALRHAFPDERRGHVAITVGAQGRIVVADDGVGLSAAAPSREAFGRSLAEMLARQIGAELVFEDAGPGTRAIVMLARRSEGAS